MHYNVGYSTILIELLKIRNNSRTLATSPVKNMNMNFLNIMLCYYFPLEAVLQGVPKNNPTEKQIDVEIQATLKYGPA